jgi:hypothetical protein
MAERKQFLLRIDPRLWAELEAWASDDLRSVNGQIEYLLREAARRHAHSESSAKRTTEKGSADERSPAEQTGS